MHHRFHNITSSTQVHYGPFPWHDHWLNPLLDAAVHVEADVDAEAAGEGVGLGSMMPARLLLEVHEERSR